VVSRRGHGVGKRVGIFPSIGSQSQRDASTYGAWVIKYLPESRPLRALTFWINDRFLDDFEYAIDGTACQSVTETETRARFPGACWSSFPMTP
jgi:hypothetical protein